MALGMIGFLENVLSPEGVPLKVIQTRLDQQIDFSAENCQY